MVKSHFEHLRRKKALEEGRNISLRQVVTETGLSMPTLLRVKAEAIARIDASTIDRLCAYFNCGVGDLLEYVPDQSAPQPITSSNKPMSRAEELAILRAHREEIRQNPDLGVKIAQNAGILDENGQLTEHYRPRDEQ